MPNSPIPSPLYIRQFCLFGGSPQAILVPVDWDVARDWFEDQVQDPRVLWASVHEFDPAGGPRTFGPPRLLYNMGHVAGLPVP